MLKVELTKNYGGFTVIGDHEDLDKLYDSLNYLVMINDEEVKDEYTMKILVYGLMYDIRHAYQGDREIVLVENYLNEYTKELFELEDVTNDNVYYSFDYIIPDLVIDIIIIKYFINKVNIKDNNIYNKYINYVNMFCSLLIDSLDGFLDKEKFNKLKSDLLSATVVNGQFVCQWFELVTIDYLNLNKTNRKKEFMKFMDKICNHLSYDEYFMLKRKIEKDAKKQNRDPIDLHYDYPVDINW